MNVILVVKYLTGISNKWYDLSMIYFFNEYESFIKKKIGQKIKFVSHYQIVLLTVFKIY